MPTSWQIAFDFVESVLGPAGWAWDRKISCPLVWVKPKIPHGRGSRIYQRGGIHHLEIRLSTNRWDGSRWLDIEICNLNLADPDSHNKLQQFIKLLDENSL